MSNTFVKFAAVSLTTLVSCATSTKLSKDSKDEITARINAKKDAFHNCYRTAAKKDKKVNGGKVVLSFQIQENGKVDRILLDDSDIITGNMINCMMDELYSIPFKTHSGPPIQFEFRFVFNPPKGRQMNIRYSDSTCNSVVASEHIIGNDPDHLPMAINYFMIGPTNDDSIIKPGNYLGPDPRLKPLYMGYETKGSTIILRFKEAAREFLNGTTCTQTVNRIPLEEMVLKVKGVKAVKFEIGGKLVEGWDA